MLQWMTTGSVDGVSTSASRYRPRPRTRRRVGSPAGTPARTNCPFESVCVEWPVLATSTRMSLSGTSPGPRMRPRSASSDMVCTCKGWRTSGALGVWWAICSGISNSTAGRGATPKANQVWGRGGSSTTTRSTAAAEATSTRSSKRVASSTAPDAQTRQRSMSRIGRRCPVPRASWSGRSSSGHTATTASPVSIAAGGAMRTGAPTASRSQATRSAVASATGPPCRSGFIASACTPENTTPRYGKAPPCFRRQRIMGRPGCEFYAASANRQRQCEAPGRDPSGSQLHDQAMYARGAANYRRSTLDLRGIEAAMSKRQKWGYGFFGGGLVLAVAFFAASAASSGEGLKSAFLAAAMVCVVAAANSLAVGITDNVKAGKWTGLIVGAVGLVAWGIAWLADQCSAGEVACTATKSSFGGPRSSPRSPGWPRCSPSSSAGVAHRDPERRWASPGRSWSGGARCRRDVAQFEQNEAARLQWLRAWYRAGNPLRHPRHRGTRGEGALTLTHRAVDAEARGAGRHPPEPGALPRHGKRSHILVIIHLSWQARIGRRCLEPPSSHAGRGARQASADGRPVLSTGSICANL